MKNITKIFLLILLALPSYTFAFDVNLKPGSRGQEVEKVQRFLIQKGYLQTTNFGYFGLATQKAVKNFQKDNSLPQTGWWYSLTRTNAKKNAGESNTTTNINQSTISSDLPIVTNVCNHTTTTPSILLLSPNGGQSYLGGTTVNIAWKGCRLSQDAKIFIAYTNTNTLSPSQATLLTDNTGNFYFDNTGSANVVLPLFGNSNVLGVTAGYPGNYYIKVFVSNNQTIYDFSDQTVFLHD